MSQDDFDFHNILSEAATLDDLRSMLSPVTTDDIVAHLGSLSPDDATALLVALLRARPDASVRAVDTCKVARAWTDQGENEVRLSLGRAGGIGGHTAFAGPLGNRGPYRKGEWMFGHPNGWTPAPDRASAKAESDAAWVADGWVLAGGGR